VRKGEAMRCAALAPRELLGAKVVLLSAEGGEVRTIALVFLIRDGLSRL
jgi:hypothetical protein